MARPALGAAPELRLTAALVAKGRNKTALVGLVNFGVTITWGRPWTSRVHLIAKALRIRERREAQLLKPLSL